MTMDAFHPDHLRPGSMVGSWRILKPLGRGGMGRVFQVEGEGSTYALKVALRPGSADAPPEEEDIDRRMGREAAFHLTHESLPGVLRVVELSRWPPTPEGYRTLVTEYVEGETLHEWRYRARPSAAKLLEVFEGLVRTVAELHRRGVHHRDLKADNVLVSREGERPYLIDFGMVALPGASTLTLGGLVGTLHTLAPEALAFVRSEAWRKGERFRGGEAGDLYALGVLLYEALTDCHPFDPHLPTQELVVAIETVTPPAPHELVPGVPQALSRMALHLLAKTPAARLPSAEALLRALWEAKKESHQHAWRVPLPLPPEGMGRQRRKSQEKEDAGDVTLPAQEGPLEEVQPQETRGEERRPAGTFYTARMALGFLWAFLARRVRWLVAALGFLLALWLLWASSVPTLQQGSVPMPTRDSRFSRLLVLLCATTGLGCPGAQVKPPQPEDCPPEAERVMFEEMQLTEGSDLRAVLDVEQPGEPYEPGTYRDGPLTGRVTVGKGGLPEGTLLRGTMWTGPGIYEDVRITPREAVIVRYTRAKLPDGREVPVCIVMGGSDGRLVKWQGSTAEAVVLPRAFAVTPVRRWP